MVPMVTPTCGACAAAGADGPLRARPASSAAMSSPSMSRILLFLALTALFTWTLPWQHSPLPGGAMWGPGLAAVVL